MKLIDLTNQTFGRLTVLAPALKKPGHYHCDCECGNFLIVAAGNLRSGNTRSCGCIRAETAAAMGKATQTHGHASGHDTGGAGASRTYKSWCSLRGRCHDLNDENYGGRGISYDPRWEEFTVFLEDMGDRPTGKSIDRIDPDGDYGPDNCRWATPEEQANNKRPKVMVRQETENEAHQG